MCFTEPTIEKSFMEDQIDTFDFPLLQCVDSSRPGSPHQDETVLKFEDARDCALEKFIPSNKPEEVCSSEEEKQLIRKSRKPKTKLGIKISKENLAEPEIVVIPPKKSWNLVAGSKPKEKLIDLELPEIESVENLTIKLPPPKENLVNLDENLILNEIKDELNLIKIEQSLDDIGSSPADATESDDSSKVLPIINLDDENIPSEQNVQTTAKGSRRKTKKKKK